ncbi:MAG: glycosyltransferase involved in cell wall biosynthesis [Flavobacteriales bacterium]|jgi:glycosyltransferase involved in cell wall biosynthesis
MQLNYSFIIPVYNRPEEVAELLESLCLLDYQDFEVVIVEDGSTIPCTSVVDVYKHRLRITYLSKVNTGPGNSRNYGMQHASGNYFLILDSDCIIPAGYLTEVHASLSASYVDFFGGPDAAHESFSDIQKAINFSMTSFLTTGGIRGGTERVERFQPRSFNMGLSKWAFESTKGFGTIHPGEDPDLVLRLWKAGFKSMLIQKAFVFHKRRISWSKFHVQVRKFGMVRPILNIWHPASKKVTFWFPTLFIVYVATAVLLALFGNLWLLATIGCYFILLFLAAMTATKSMRIAIFAIFATLIQFFGYGTGFIKSTYFIGWLKKNPRIKFPQLFFS